MDQLSRLLSSFCFSTMQIFVRTNRTHTVELLPDATLDAVRSILESRGDRHDWKFFYFASGSRILPEGVKLSTLAIPNDCLLELRGRLLGGGKKRKKKTYTKPKKPKHKRQHEKLRALKMYKVEGQKVIRCKKECPTCGPGIFMATHFDRISCGKCSTTYLYEAGDQ